MPKSAQGRLEVGNGVEQFRALANAIPNLAWIANADAYIFCYNQRWYEYTGATPEKMEGWGWQSVHDPNRLPSVMERWMVSIQTGEPFEMIFLLRGANGVFRSFLTRVVPIKNSKGTIAGLEATPMLKSFGSRRRCGKANRDCG
jgi:PAS domain S-box-containing protein